MWHTKDRYPKYIFFWGGNKIKNLTLNEELKSNSDVLPYIRRVNYDFTSCAKQNNLKHAIPALAGNVSSAVLIKFIQL